MPGPGEIRVGRRGDRDPHAGMNRALEPCYFRTEYGRLVAMLSRRVGVRLLQAVEDAVQAALLAAVDHWPRAGLPDHPSAWLSRVASNRLLGELQRVRRHAELDRQSHDAADEDIQPSSVHLD